MKKFLTFLILVIVLAIIYWIWAYTNVFTLSNNKGRTVLANAMYMCNDNKTIEADYYDGRNTPSNPNTPPTPSGSVDLRLSDGREMTLDQTISASGIRYSDGDPNTAGNESIVFWSKGNGALILENNNDQTYIGCIKVAPNTGDLPQIYEDSSLGFSIRYPASFKIDTDYNYEALGPNKKIQGVKFTIDPAIAKDTNLSNDSYLSVEEISQTNSCGAELFLNRTSNTPTTETIGDTTFSVASSTDAGLGNRYEETVYAIPGTNPCVAVRYFIHYGVLENYPTGSIKAFDKESLLNQFGNMRDTLIINQ